MFEFGSFKISKRKGVYLIEIREKDFEKFYSDIGKVLLVRKRTKTKKKRKIVKNKKEDRIRECAVQLMNAYNKARKKFRGKNVSQLTESSNQFDYFLKAIPILERHKVSYHKFIESQIRGLSFVDGGKGAFPSPNHLTTVMAEERLLDFLGVRGKNSPVVKLRKVDRETILGQNARYMGRRRKILDGVATLAEAQYVCELQKFRKDEVDPFVEDYIRDLESE